MTERRLVIIVVANLVVVTLITGLFVADGIAEAIVLGSSLAGSWFSVFTLGRIHGARPWRALLIATIGAMNGHAGKPKRTEEREERE